MVASKIKAFWNHPAGLKTIFFWAPTFKWGLNIANLADLEKPPQDISYPLQTALIISGAIWIRYSLVAKPKNWNLLTANVGMGAIAATQLGRKYKHDLIIEEEAMAAKLD